MIDSNSIDNYKECINKVKNEFNLKPQQIEKIKNTSDKYKRDDIEITDNNFLKLVGEKIMYYKENYFNKNNQDDILSEEEKEKSKELKETLMKNNMLKKDAKDKNSERNKKKRRFEILKNNLIFLRDNGITPSDYLNKNPFNFKPFQYKESIEFFDYIKYDKFDEMENMLRNKDLLFCYDYFHQTPFHWAAKRDKIRATKIMLMYGNCINLLDSNKMTPLAFAAQNNNYDMVVLLCENGANPFMKNIDGKKPSDLCTDFKTKSYLLYIEDTFSPGLKKNIKKK